MIQTKIFFFTKHPNKAEFKNLDDTEVNDAAEVSKA